MMCRNHILAATAILLIYLVLVAGCGQERTKQSVEHHEEHTTTEDIIVKLDQHKVYHAGIKVEPVAKHSIPIPLALPGKVSFNEKKVAHISARIGGRVETVRVFTNDPAHASEVLMQLFSQDFSTIQFEFLQAVRRVDRTTDANTEERTNARALYESARRKLSVIGMTEVELKDLESTKTPKTFYDVRAPFDGIVLESKISLGESVEPGTELFEFANLETLWVLAEVYEKDLPHVRTGMKATVAVNAYARSWSGAVTSIYSVLDEKTRTVKARIEVNNTDRLLKPEMFCTVNIQTQLGKETIKIPASALLGETEKHFVFVSVNDTTFEKRDVRTGTETREFVEVLDGIVEGEKIVVRGGFFLKSELAKETFGEEH